MSEPVLLVDRKGAVAVVTMNRPGTKNALNPELVDALSQTVPSLTADDAVRVVILTGAGAAFCSGADLKAGAADNDVPMDQRMDQMHAIVKSIVRAPKPFIAAVGGAAVGFGCDLALACDLRVLSTHAYLQEIFVRIGLMPDGGGTFLMPRLVGLGRAMEYMLQGTRIGAEMAREVGLANRVVDSDDLMKAALELGDELAKGPPLAFARIKQAVRASAGGTLDDALAREKASQLELLGSKDFFEGVMAWAQRKTPAFKGE